MERLTSCENKCKREMICRYEDCDTCEEYCPLVNENDCPCLQEILDRLAEYEDLKEQGKLLELPCKVGDMTLGMISEQVKELKEYAEIHAKCFKWHTADLLAKAANTIEALSAKLSAANKEIENLNVIQEVAEEIAENMKWIPCSERLPEEKINPVTGDFQEYDVTFSDGEIYDVRHYKFGKGHWWHYGEMMDKYVTAWMPLQPYTGNCME